METNPIPFFLAALVPLALGFVWYHDKVFGGAWQRAVGLTAEAVAKGPKPVVFVIAYLLSLMFAFAIYGIAVHQTSILSLFLSLEGFGEEGAAVQEQFDALMIQFADHHRTFGHGAFHGAMAGVFIAVPVLVTNGMFERRPVKLHLINAGYWIVVTTIIGGIVCQFA